MWIQKSDHEWLLEHAAQDGDGTWRCKATNNAIQVDTVGRSIHLKQFDAGFGEVRRVGHLSCSECQPDFKAPELGKPVYEEDLLEAV